MKCLYFCILFFFSGIQAQPLIQQVQYGASINAKIELRNFRHDEPNFNFRISMAAGVASSWFLDEIYPSLHGELQFYNGGLGSDSRPDKRKCTLDAILAFTCTTGRLNKYYKKEEYDAARFVPLRYFADFAVPPLQNPFNYSVSLGSIFVFTSDENKSSQRVGFAGLLAAEFFQFSYYNDGTPFKYTQTADLKDRYYTGGGVLSYSNKRGKIDILSSYHFEISYHKFTGYTQDAFEISNVLNTSNIDYKSDVQTWYNKSRWKVSAGLVSNDDIGYTIALANYNRSSWDGQHLIHWLIRNSYHIVPYEENITLEPSVFYTNNSFNLR